MSIPTENLSEKDSGVPAAQCAGDTDDPAQPDSAATEDVAHHEGAISAESNSDIAPNGHDDVGTDGDGDTTVFAADSLRDLPDSQRTPILISEPGNATSEHSVARAEILKMQESLKESLAQTHSILSKINLVSSVTDDLLKQVAGISNMLEIQAQEKETSSSSARTNNVFSKTFLGVSSGALALLVAFQLYMFTSLIGIQRLQNVTGTSLLGNISSLNKKIADFDNKFAKFLEKPVQQEHARPKPAASSPAAPEMAGNETEGKNEVGSAHVTLVLEKLNKMRNGLAEKKIIRKESGDWFVYNKKGNESISDVDILKALNDAYAKHARSILTPVPLPVHTTVCVLKPDGKGGTLVVVTKQLLP